MAETDDSFLRQQLVALLTGGQAHATLDDAVNEFPQDRIGEQPKGVPYSAWQLLEHMRIVLRDLLDFSTNPEYLEMEWPAAYWPKHARPADGQSWSATLKAIREDLKAFEDLVQSPESNLYAAIPWGKNKETLLREVLLAADHTSYHTGELILLRRVMGIWES